MCEVNPSMNVVDWKEEDGLGYYAFIAFVVGYGACVGESSATSGWLLQGGGEEQLHLLHLQAAICLHALPLPSPHQFASRRISPSILQ